MKHIKKVFLQLENSNFPIDESSEPKSLQSFKSVNQYIAVRKGEDGKNFLAFIHKNKDTKDNFVINIPIMPMVFYDSAYTTHLQLKVVKKELFELLNKENHTGKYFPDSEHSVYRFIGFATSVITLLCNSLECFANETISNKKYSFKNDLKTKTEIFDNYQTQNYIDIKTKLFKILPEIFSKKINPNSLFLQPIHKLIELRNDIIHLKLKENLVLERSEIVRRLLNYDYEKILIDVRYFINYFIPDYLRDCDCEQNF